MRNRQYRKRIWLGVAVVAAIGVAACNKDKTEHAGAPPARSTVEVSRLPKDVLVEIEAIAYLG